MNSKCNKCGLVNLAGDLACRRCGGILGMPVRQSLSKDKATYPRYLFLLPFLLLAFGIGFWSNQIKKSAIAAMNVDKEEWHHQTMDNKVGPMDPKVENKPRDPFEGISPDQREKDRKQLEQYQEARQRSVETKRFPEPDQPATSQPTQTPQAPTPHPFNTPR